MAWCRWSRRARLDGMELFKGMMAGKFPAPPISRMLGMKMEGAEPGRVVFGYTPLFDHYNPLGSVHGGIAATLLDSVMGCCIHTMLKAGVGYTTVEIKVNYVRAMTDKTGPVRAEGKVINVGSRIATSGKAGCWMLRASSWPTARPPASSSRSSLHCGMPQAAAEQGLLKLSIAVTIAVAAVGVVFGLLSGSLSIVFDGVFGAIDAAMSVLALFVSRLVSRVADNPRFQFGYWHIERMVLAFNGGTLMLLCFYAFLNAIGSILDGGRRLDFDWAMAYAVAVGIVAFGMFFYARHRNRQIGSDFVRLDAQSWLMSASITSALLLAFAVAWALEGTRYAHRRPTPIRSSWRRSRSAWSSCPSAPCARR